MGSVRGLVPNAVVVAMLLAGRAASAQSEESPATLSPGRRDARARAAFERGISLADRLQWSEAAAAFEQSFDLVPRPATLMNLGLAHRALGRYAQAIDELSRFVAQIDTAPEIALQMRTIITEMRARLATVTIHTVPTVATLTVDDAMRTPGDAFVADPGRHVVAAAAQGFRRNVQTLGLHAGERRVFEIRLEAVRSASAAPWIIGTGVVIATGVAVAIALVVGGSERPPMCGAVATCITAP